MCRRHARSCKLEHSDFSKLCQIRLNLWNIYVYRVTPISTLAKIQVLLDNLSPY